MPCWRAGRARQETAILGEVELPVRQELRVLPELRGRGVLRGLDDLFIRDANATLLVFLMKQDVVDQLVESLLVHFSPLVDRQAATRLLLLLLRKGGGRVRPDHVRNVLAVHRRHDRRGRDRGASQQAGCLGQQEAAHEGDEDEDPDVLRGAPHVLQHGAATPRNEVRK